MFAFAPSPPSVTPLQVWWGVVKSDSSPYILQEQDVLKNINIVGMFKSKFSSELWSCFSTCQNVNNSPLLPPRPESCNYKNPFKQFVLHPYQLALPPHKCAKVIPSDRRVTFYELVAGSPAVFTGLIIWSTKLRSDYFNDPSYKYGSSCHYQIVTRWKSHFMPWSSN